MEIKIVRMWYLKTQTIQIIIVPLEMIKKNTDRYTKNIPGDISLYELKQIVIMNALPYTEKISSYNTLNNFQRK